QPSPMLGALRVRRHLIEKRAPIAARRRGLRCGQPDTRRHPAPDEGSLETDVTVRPVFMARRRAKTNARAGMRGPKPRAARQLIPLLVISHFDAAVRGELNRGITFQMFIQKTAVA